VWHRLLSELSRDADFEAVFMARFSLTGGEAGDSPQALPLFKDLRPGSVSADKAYDSDAIIEHLTAAGIEPVIPPRSNRLVQRHFDKHLYKNRNLVGRFFCRIKQFRRIGPRYDKLAARFLRRDCCRCHLAGLYVNRP